MAVSSQEGFLFSREAGNAGKRQDVLFGVSQSLRWSRNSSRFNVTTERVIGQPSGCKATALGLRSMVLLCVLCKFYRAMGQALRHLQESSPVPGLPPSASRGGRQRKPQTH